MKKVLIIILTLIVFAFIIGYNSYKKELKEARASLRSKSELVIISHVKLAYTQAYAKNFSYPTLEQVKLEYNNMSKNWNGNEITSYEGASCIVSKENSKLQVKCKDNELTEELILSGD